MGHIDGPHLATLIDRPARVVARPPAEDQADAVDVALDGTGVKVNDRLQTTDTRIYTAGEVCTPYKLTHAAGFLARIIIQNALFLGRAKASAFTIPWCIYTIPRSPTSASASGMYRLSASESRPASEARRRRARNSRRGTPGFRHDPHSTGSGQDPRRDSRRATRRGNVARADPRHHPRHGAREDRQDHLYGSDAIRKLGEAYNRTRLTPFLRKVTRT